MTTSYTEDAVELWMQDLLTEAGWTPVHGHDIAPDTQHAERSSWQDVLLTDRLTTAVERLNPTIPADARGEAIRQLIGATSQNLVEDNAHLHRLLIEGATVEVEQDGVRRPRAVHFIDFGPDNDNDLLTVRQLTVVDRVAGQETRRRTDLVGYVNGLPLVLIELKNPSDEEATVKTAWQQLQTYKSELPTLLRYNAALVISDGIDARVGSLTAPFEHFAPWKTIDGTRESADGVSPLETIVRGLLHPDQFLTWLRDYTVFSDEKPGLVKKQAKYHQFWAVEKAIEATRHAIAGDGRVGVVWHTQGSGKSFEMHCYAAKAMRDDSLGNPTIVLLTDRNDLDDQLHDEVFLPSLGRGFLPEAPQQADSKEDLRQLLKRPSGGLIFTVINKFGLDHANDEQRMPVLSDRENIVVVVDEAHRSNYDFIDGFARHMRDALPNAAFLGFTGTPIDTDDKSTQAVFGEYIDVYDITDAIADGATVPIYYESRLVKVTLPAAKATELDVKADEILEGLSDEEAAAMMQRWASTDTIAASPELISQIANDVIAHWETRRDTMDGKAMIVAPTREAAVALYDSIIQLRPDWHDPDDARGCIKLVMSGSASDPAEWQQHVRSKAVARDLKLRAKNPDDPLEMVMVVDMWLTGFDAPPMHTMYVAKSLKAHNLMQAIARVNRTWRDKPAGLIVDYIGITDDLRRALHSYSDKDRSQVGISLDEGAQALRIAFDIVEGLLAGHDWPKDERDVGKAMTGVSLTVEWLLDNDAPPGDDVDEEDVNDLVNRYKDATLALAKAHALAASHPAALELADNVRYLLAVRAALIKLDTTTTRGSASTDAASALRTLVSAAISTDGVLDVFAQAGLSTPELSIFSDDFLDRVRNLKGNENLRLKLLQKLLNEELQSVRGRSVVRFDKFSEQLQQAINRYRTRAITSGQIIEELIALAREIRSSAENVGKSDLSADEYAFYEALAADGSAQLEMSDEKLKALAAELVEQLKREVSIDWDRKTTVQAKIRAKVKRLLRLRGYPPQYSEQAINLLLQQTDLFARQWAGEPAAQR